MATKRAGAKKSAGARRRPRLTRDGKPVKKLESDAPRPLQALALTQLPGSVKGPAMKGAWARGWCDGVRGRKVRESNPYGAVGWMQPMRVTYVEGWRAGKQVARLEHESGELSEVRYQALQRVGARVHEILRGEIASEAAATRAIRRRAR